MKTECYDPDQLANGEPRGNEGPVFSGFGQKTNQELPSTPVPVEEVIDQEEAKAVQFSTGRFCPEFDRR